MRYEFLTFLRVTHFASRFTSKDSGFRKELLPAYSGGTVMDLHHLPRHYRIISLNDPQ